MAKLYFVETESGSLLTVAIKNEPEHTREDNRACYMWQDGQEENFPCNNPRWDDAGKAEREEIATEWLQQIAECNDFEGLYSDCDCYGGFRGVYTTNDFWADIARGDVIISEADFG